MIDRPRLEKPTAGACCRCGAPLAGDDIFHWSPGSWSVWCFPCYKAEHFHNLVRIQQRSKERRANLAKNRLNAIEVKLNVKRMHGAKRAPRTVIDETVIARVAEIYNANPGNANKAVALAFGVSLPGARERIKKARNLGLLPPSPDHYRNRKKRGNV